MQTFMSHLNRPHLLRLCLALSVLLGVTACATRPVPFAADLDVARLPTPNVNLQIDGLGPCTDSPDRSLRLTSGQPVHVLVHGCFGSAGQFRALAQVLAFQGQQSACFSYDDRARLDDSAGLLLKALEQLGQGSPGAPVTVIGHSQGALIARRALTEVHVPQDNKPPVPPLSLVTISGPFSGIASAQTCGRQWLYPLTLGLLPLSCHIATGPKWNDITFSSDFIRRPGRLAPDVSRYLKIDTDETGSCRREVDGRCVEDDNIFSLAEQRSAVAVEDARQVRVELKAGHVEMVGDQRQVPTQLITVLQEQGVLAPTPAAQALGFRRMLARVYQASHTP
jgi:hypothetical protein